jgi:hypothetical protein
MASFLNSHGLKVKKIWPVGMIADMGKTPQSVAGDAAIFP